MTLGDYFRINMDARDLNYMNYDKYFTKGIKEVEALEDYTSHNARRLGLTELEDLLLSLTEVRRELGVD